jgi:glycosyltransferase involved in cell wall biosynthesis
MVTGEDRIQCFTIKEVHYNRLWEMHYYTRYIGEHTDLYCFGNGLGDQTCMSQVGDCFLELMDEGYDPELGRIIMSFGRGSTAFRNFHGDHVVVWAWGLDPENLEEYLKKFMVKAKLVLNPYQRVRDKAEELGYDSLRFWAGVNPRQFKPLGYEREGVGFAGRPKSKEQNRIILEPVQGRPDFEWINKHPENSTYLTIDEYNKWLNTKKLVLGMVAEDRHHVTFVPTRLFEALAAGTPLLTYKINGVKEHLGFEYPYMVTKPGETSLYVNYIINNYGVVHEKALEWSKLVREKHSYKVRLLELFRKLEEIKG